MKSSSLLCLVIALAGSALAEDGKGYRLDQVSWGDPVEESKAPAFNPADLKNKVVVVEEFGVRIDVCLNRIKELGRLCKRIGRDKLPVAVVAIHRQREVPDKEIVEAVKDARGDEVTILKNGFLPASIGGMPHAAIFLPDGSMAWHGDSTGREFEKQLKQALQAAATPP
jgi:hypothetical protein